MAKALIWLNLVLALGCADHPGGAPEGRGGMSGAAGNGNGNGNGNGGSSVGGGSASESAGTNGHAGASGGVGTAAAGAQGSEPGADVTNLIAAYCAAVRSC